LAIPEWTAATTASARLDFGDDRQRDLLRRLRSDVEAHRCPDPLLRSLERDAHAGQPHEHALSAVSRSQHADERNRRAQPGRQELEIAVVVVVHDDRGVAVGLLDRERDVSQPVIDHRHVPTQQLCHGHQRSGIRSGATHAQPYAARPYLIGDVHLLTAPGVVHGCRSAGP